MIKSTFRRPRPPSRYLDQVEMVTSSSSAGHNQPVAGTPAPYQTAPPRPTPLPAVKGRVHWEPDAVRAHDR